MKHDKKDTDDELHVKLALLLELLQKIILKEQTSDGIIRAISKDELPFPAPHEQFDIQPQPILHEKLMKGMGLFRMKAIEYAARVGFTGFVNPKILEDAINVIGKSFYRRHGKQMLEDIAKTEIIIPRFNEKSKANYSLNPSHEIDKLLKSVFRGLAPLKIQIDTDEENFNYEVRVRLLHDIKLPECSGFFISNTAKYEAKYRYVFGDTISIEVIGNNRPPQTHTITLKPKHSAPEFHLIVIYPQKNRSEAV